MKLCKFRSEKLKLLNQMVYSDSQKVIGRSLRVCECDLAKTVKRIQKKNIKSKLKVTHCRKQNFDCRAILPMVGKDI